MESNYLINISGIITNTPWWVWLIFFYLIFVGKQSTKSRSIYLPKLFIIPIILLLVKYEVFLSVNAWFYIGCMIVGIVIGYVANRLKKLKINKETAVIEIPGEYSTAS
jgi:hypothetical protein